MITASHLSKEFLIDRNKTEYIRGKILGKTEKSSYKAVDDVSFYIPKGELVGLIGSNGAGKTTLIHLMGGSLQSSGGIIRVFNLDPCKDRKMIAPRIGTISGCHSQLWKDLPLLDSFELVGSMYHIPRNLFRNQLNMLCEMFQLNGVSSNLVENLSLGQRMRAEFVYSMLHNPEILILDEPTIALDLSGKEQIYRMLKTAVKKNGMTVVLTTSDVRELEHLCTRVMLMDKGKIIYDGDAGRFKSEYAFQHTIKIELLDGLPDLQDLPILRYSITHNTMRISYDSKLISKGTILSHIISQCRIKDIQTIELDIEDVLSEIFKK